MNTKIEEYWQSFIIKNNLDIELKYYESFKFGHNVKQADELLNLVLIGKKSVTTSPYFDFEKYPKINDYSIVLDSLDNPRCIIQTKDYKIIKFNEVTFNLIKDEGEDEVLETWLHNHKIFLEESCKEKNIEFREDMFVFIEYFRVVFL